jgi:exodeoxyribonuclease VII large subunit
VDVEEVKLKIDNYRERYKRALRKKVEFMRLRYEKALASKIFKEPTQKINEYYINIDMKIKNMEMIIQSKIREAKLKAINYTEKLDALSPLKTLTRGYSIVEKEGNLLKSTKQVHKNDHINIRLEDGKITAIVNNIE